MLILKGGELMYKLLRLEVVVGSDGGMRISGALGASLSVCDLNMLCLARPRSETDDPRFRHRLLARAGVSLREYADF
jgi:hypothetical protein